MLSSVLSDAFLAGGFVVVFRGSKLYINTYQNLGMKKVPELENVRRYQCINELMLAFTRKGS